jgi:hypothetical protein
MVHLESISTGAFEGIAEPHQSTVVAILRAARLGLFSATEAEMMIDRVRKLAGPKPAGA